MKGNKGITLIALVITIIVLLILAGISIAMLTGGNGLLTKAAEAEVQNVRGEACDKINTAINACYAEILSHQYGVGEDLLNSSAAETIKNNNDFSISHGKIEVTHADTDGITITWTPDETKDKDYGDPIEGKIVKDTVNSEKKKIPYTVTAATINQKAAEASASASPAG